MNKYNDSEIQIIKNYNFDPANVTKDQIFEIKEKQLEKSFEFLSKFVAEYNKKKEKLDKIDPTYFPEVVNPELSKIKKYLDNFNPKQIPLDFYEKSFRKTIDTAQLKMAYELEARVNYIKVLNQVNKNKD